MAVSIEGKYTGLRARLVIENETISGHCDRVAALRAEFPHTIRCIGQPVDGTCVTYAFGLLDGTPRLVAELEGLGVKAGGAFVQWLMDEEHLVEIETARTNGLALYLRVTCRYHERRGSSYLEVGYVWRLRSPPLRGTGRLREPGSIF